MGYVSSRGGQPFTTFHKSTWASALPTVPVTQNKDEKTATSLTAPSSEYSSTSAPYLLTTALPLSHARLMKQNNLMDVVQQAEIRRDQRTREMYVLKPCGVI